MKRFGKQLFVHMYRWQLFLRIPEKMRAKKKIIENTKKILEIIVENAKKEMNMQPAPVLIAVVNSKEEKSPFGTVPVFGFLTDNNDQGVCEFIKVAVEVGLSEAHHRAQIMSTIRDQRKIAENIIEESAKSMGKRMGWAFKPFVDILIAAFSSKQEEMIEKICNCFGMDVNRKFIDKMKQMHRNGNYWKHIIGCSFLKIIPVVGIFAGFIGDVDIQTRNLGYGVLNMLSEKAISKQNTIGSTNLKMEDF